MDGVDSIPHDRHPVVENPEQIIIVDLSVDYVITTVELGKDVEEMVGCGAGTEVGDVAGRKAEGTTVGRFKAVDIDGIIVKNIIRPT